VDDGPWNFEQFVIGPCYTARKPLLIADATIDVFPFRVTFRVVVVSCAMFRGSGMQRWDNRRFPLITPEAILNPTLSSHIRSVIEE
jgi:hypothetical protein